MFGNPFSSHNPFPESSDRCPREWLDVMPAFVEQGTGYRHVRKTHRATGQAWICIESPRGNLLAEFSLGSAYPRVTVIRRDGGEHDLGRETYGLKQGCEPPETIELSQLKALVSSGEAVLLSGEDAPIVGQSSTTVNRWDTVWGEHGQPLGRRTASEEYSAAGGLASRQVGTRETAFDEGEGVAAPLHTTDKRSGERDAVYTVDMISEVGQRTRIVDEGRPVHETRRVSTGTPGRNTSDAVPRVESQPRPQHTGSHLLNIPRPNDDLADANYLADSNIRYQNERSEQLNKWQALPWWRRLFTPRP